MPLDPGHTADIRPESRVLRPDIAEWLAKVLQDRMLSSVDSLSEESLSAIQTAIEQLTASSAFDLEHAPVLMRLLDEAEEYELHGYVEIEWRERIHYYRSHWKRLFREIDELYAELKKEQDQSGNSVYSELLDEQIRRREEIRDRIIAELTQYGNAHPAYEALKEWTLKYPRRAFRHGLSVVFKEVLK